MCSHIRSNYLVPCINTLTDYKDICLPDFKDICIEIINLRELFHIYTIAIGVVYHLVLYNRRLFKDAIWPSQSQGCGAKKIIWHSLLLAKSESWKAIMEKAI